MINSRNGSLGVDGLLLEMDHSVWMGSYYRSSCYLGTSLYSCRKIHEDYFAFWVLISVAWGVGITITFLPIMESSAEISNVFNGIIGRGGEANEEYVEKKENFDDA